MAELKKEFIGLLREKHEKGEVLTTSSIMKTLSCSNSLARTYRTILDNYLILEGVFSDSEVIEEGQKLARSKQKYMDSNRIERKIFREDSRRLNTLEELNRKLIEGLDKVSLNTKTYEPANITYSDNAILVQISDTHFNELVDLETNKYDFKVAAKRLQKYADEVKTMIKTYTVGKVVIAMTGDLVNSDRRLDEKMNMATNRTLAALLATSLLEYFILDLASATSKVFVTYVSGNESRVDKEFGTTNMLISDNYDTLIFNILRKVFSKQKSNVSFIEPTDPNESIITINDKNILMFHGTTVGSATQKKIQEIIGKFSAKGIRVHYAIFGHIHFAEITDLYARSGSLVGSNSYSEVSLNLISHPSQNVHLIKENGQINNTRIELSRIEGYEGYPISSEIDAYNAKSVDKCRVKHSILEVVI